MNSKCGPLRSIKKVVIAMNWVSCPGSENNWRGTADQERKY